ncbi:MAG: HAD-superfamily hydrolase, subfamily variant 1 [Frankiales bacterium]|nr:HAD-superfamily hydrolase, subfamily variant 1 [Frankiales bacterium]
MIEAVLFDWGGTLSTHGDWDLLGMWRAAAEVLAPDDPDPVAQALLDAELAWWHDRVRDGDGTGSGSTEDIVRSVAAQTHLPVQQALAAYHGAWEETVDHDPSAEVVLQGCKARGWKTGLLSNTHWPRELHERWLAEAGLLDLLDARVYTSDLGHMKPHPIAFHTLLDAVDVRPENAVFVGDRPRDDIRGAQASGLRAVLLTGRAVEQVEVVPDAELAELAGLLALLDSDLSG